MSEASPEATVDPAPLPGTAPPGAPSTGRLRSPLESAGAAALWSAVLAVVVFANSVANGFAYDDAHIIQGNYGLHSLANFPAYLMEPYWPGEFGDLLGLWRPGAILAWGLQWAAWGDTPGLFHVVNALAHGVATALVVLLLVRIATVPVAFAAGLLFAVHPVHVEAVANVVGLAEVLSTVFFLGACLLHVDAREEGYGSFRLLGVAGLYLAAFSVKESAVTLPAALFLLDAARGRLAAADLPGYLRRRGLVYVALAAVAAAMLLLRYTVLGSVASPMVALGADLLAHPDVPRIWTLAGIWTHYVRLLVFPVDLSADYTPSVIPIGLAWNPLAISGAVLALGLLALALWAWRGRALGRGRASRRLFGFGVVWFLVTISPVANVVFLSGVLLAERTFYLPSVGFVAAAGWALVRLGEERRRLALGITAAAVLLMAARTWTRTPTWKSTETVFQTLLADYPQSGRSQWVLGDLFFNRGQVSQSLQAYRLAVGLLGGHYQIMVEVGKKLMVAGREDAAVTILMKAWRDHPQFSPAPDFLAVSTFNAGRWAEAERFARAAILLSPANSVLSHALAGSLAQQDELEEAALWRERTIALGEGEHWQQWMSLASLRLALGDSARARSALDSALVRVEPGERGRLMEAFRPFEPPPDVLQDSTQLQDARGGAAPEGVPGMGHNRSNSL